MRYTRMSASCATPQAKEQMPEVAAGMNRNEKIVFSRTLDGSDWSNTKIVSGALFEEVRKLKVAAGKGITILGSGSLVAQLAPTGLVDEYQLVVNPVVIG